MNDVRIIRNGPIERLVVSASPDALPPVDIQPARPALDHVGKRFSEPARRSYPKASSGLRDACMAVGLSVAPLLLLALICWAVLTFGPGVRQLLGV